MFFSARIKQELEKQVGSARHCQIAELSALLSYGAKVATGEEDVLIRFSSEYRLVYRKSIMLMRKLFPGLSIGEIEEDERSILLPLEEAEELFLACKLIQVPGENGDYLDFGSGIFLQKDCCRRAFFRGAYLAAGSMSNPENSYHLEVVCGTLPKAEFLAHILDSFSIAAKVIERKQHFVIYIKDGAGIVESLGLMEAHSALMDFENIRILKEMRNSVNRKVNCETSNIRKTVSAASRQIEDIQLLEDNGVLYQLPDATIEIAHLRREFPEATLLELGQMLHPPIGKSGVNHRLRKISQMAEKYHE